MNETKTGGVLKTHVRHLDTDLWWFVSTIYRESSTMEISHHYETLVWTWNPGTRSQGGNILWQGEGLNDHWRIVRFLAIHGHVPAYDEEI